MSTQQQPATQQPLEPAPEGVTFRPVYVDAMNTFYNLAGSNWLNSGTLWLETVVKFLDHAAELKMPQIIFVLPVDVYEAIAGRFTGEPKEMLEELRASGMIMVSPAWFSPNSLPQNLPFESPVDQFRVYRQPKSGSRVKHYWAVSDDLAIIDGAYRKSGLVMSYDAYRDHRVTKDGRDPRARHYAYRHQIKAKNPNLFTVVSPNVTDIRRFYDCPDVPSTTSDSTRQGEVRAPPTPDPSLGGEEEDEDEDEDFEELDYDAYYHSTTGAAAAASGDEELSCSESVEQWASKRVEGPDHPHGDWVIGARPCEDEDLPPGFERPSSSQPATLADAPSSPVPPQLPANLREGFNWDSSSSSS